MFRNTNFDGGDLTAGGLETRSYQECSLECQKRPQCHFWTFIGKWEANCYLKSRLGEMSDDKDRISGTFGTNCGKITHKDIHCSTYILDLLYLPSYSGAGAF